MKLDPKIVEAASDYRDDRHHSAGAIRSTDASSTEVLRGDFLEMANELMMTRADVLEAQAAELTRLREQCEAKDAEIERLRKALIGR